MFKRCWFCVGLEPYYKKISRRTHAEIATDLGLVTASNEAFLIEIELRSETISSVPVSLDAYLPQGGFISSYNTSSWEVQTDLLMPLMVVTLNFLTVIMILII
ncbi:hypothetical protein [Chryseobacterium indoltheticum]|uniref:hypothetical protein n=1 Tax=Chryseobacterium indoltheticum TaxID=254 RepID=UPI003F4991C8